MKLVKSPPEDTLEPLCLWNDCASSSSATTPTPVVGSFIAFCCVKYDFVPQIGRVKSFDESSLALEWLDGTYMIVPAEA